uniref:Uncharacterized protein n=1 Tax=Vespula pensylvanica TaxID=30213 RepID=A0A834K0V9_VESPE|nr:hypothetical protein H0235_016025 [Vespula pensylvanica]
MKRRFGEGYQRRPRGACAERYWHKQDRCCLLITNNKNDDDDDHDVDDDDENHDDDCSSDEYDDIHRGRRDGDEDVDDYDNKYTEINTQIRKKLMLGREERSRQIDR